MISGRRPRRPGAEPRRPQHASTALARSLCQRPPILSPRPPSHGSMMMLDIMPRRPGAPLPRGLEPRWPGTCPGPGLGPGGPGPRPRAPGRRQHRGHCPTWRRDSCGRSPGLPGRRRRRGGPSCGPWSLPRVAAAALTVTVPGPRRRHPGRRARPGQSCRGQSWCPAGPGPYRTAMAARASARRRPSRPGTENCQWPG